MIPLEEAKEFVLAGCPAPSTTVTTTLAGALGCVLAAPVVSSEAVPPFANTATDPAKLRIVGTLAAGVAPDVAVEQGQAVRIMTGAPIPPGADAVVPVELTSASGEEVEI